MQTDKRADKKKSFSENTVGFSVRGKSLSSSKPRKNVGQERHVHRGNKPKRASFFKSILYVGVSKDDNTSTYEKRLKTHFSIAVVDRAGSGTQVRGAAKAVRKQKDDRNERLHIIKSR